MKARAASLVIIALVTCASPPPLVHKSTLKAREGVLIVCGAVDNFAILNAGRFPKTLEWLVTQDVKGVALLENRKLLIDPWGEHYYYEPPREGVRGYRVYTYGKDRTFGGEGQDTDVDNWMIQDGEL